MWEISTPSRKRLKRITGAGPACAQASNHRARGGNPAIGEQFSAQDNGTLSIASPLTQARYVPASPWAHAWA